MNGKSGKAMTLRMCSEVRSQGGVRRGERRGLRLGGSQFSVILIKVTEGPGESSLSAGSVLRNHEAQPCHFASKEAVTQTGHDSSLVTWCLRHSGPGPGP